MNLFNPLQMRNLAVCGGISSGAAFDCDAIPQAGMQPKIWLANRSDIASYTFDPADASLVTAITMNQGGAFYVFDGYRQSVSAEIQFVPQTLTSGYKHLVSLQVFDLSTTQKLNLEKMALTKVVAIVENQNVDGNANSIFEIFGSGIGMEVETLTRINRDLETAGSFSVGLGTSDNEGQEAKMALSFFDTDYATTLAAVVALETPAP